MFKSKRKFCKLSLDLKRNRKKKLKNEKSPRPNSSYHDKHMTKIMRLRHPHRKDIQKKNKETHFLIKSTSNAEMKKKIRCKKITKKVDVNLG
jgi:hypothetical protein